MRGIVSKYRSVILLVSLLGVNYVLSRVSSVEIAKTKNPIDIKEADRDDDALVTITRDGRVYLGSGRDKVQVTDPNPGNVELDGATEIRVRNASQVDLQDVVVDGQNFGDVKQGTFTEYRKSKAVPPSPSASALTNSKPMRSQPIFYGAEREVGVGHFTYIITIEDGALRLRAERDKD